MFIVIYEDQARLHQLVETIFFVSFVDDFSRRIWVYTIRANDEVLEIFREIEETGSD